MDRNRFDALTRLLGTAGSRRTAIGAAIGAALLGTHPLVTDAAKNKKKRRRRRRRNRNQPTTCFGTLLCEFPSDGLDFENCDLAGTDIPTCDGCTFRRADLGGADLEDGSFQGVNFRNANLRSANLEDADVSGASFRDACLANADFSGANTDGARFDGAIFCNTVLSDGSIDNSGCDDVTECCPPGDCVGEICDGTCCEVPCSCFEAVPGPGDACVDADIGDCDFPCIKDPDCPEDWLCIDDGSCGFTHCHPACGVVVGVLSEARRGRSHRK